MEKLTDELMEEIVTKWGKFAQVLMLIEEMAELQQALCKSFRVDILDDETLDNIPEEMADVSLMLEQVQYIFQCKSFVEEWKEKKLKRLKGRLQNSP